MIVFGNLDPLLQSVDCYVINTRIGTVIIGSPISVISPVFDGSGLHTTRPNSGFGIRIGTLVPILKGCVFSPDPVTGNFQIRVPGLFDYYMIHF